MEKKTSLFSASFANPAPRLQDSRDLAEGEWLLVSLTGVPICV